MTGYAVEHLSDMDERTDGRCRFRAVRQRLGISAFGAVAWSGHAAGDPVVDAHDDSSADEELFVVLSGHAVFQVDGERVDAPTGACIFVPPGADRTARAEAPGTTVLLVEGTPGQAYDARGWELWAPLAPLYDEGRYDEVAAGLRAAVAEWPQYGLLFFNLACCESRTGRVDDALEHLRTAIRLADRFRAEARADPDLDAVRADPRFAAVVDG